MEGLSQEAIEVIRELLTHYFTDADFTFNGVTNREREIIRTPRIMMEICNWARFPYKHMEGQIYYFHNNDNDPNMAEYHGLECTVVDAMTTSDDFVTAHFHKDDEEFPVQIKDLTPTGERDERF